MQVENNNRRQISGRLLTRINRVSAWILLITMLLYFVSGYGMTKGLIDSSVATRLHVTILPPFVIASFIVHSFLSIRMSFIRWKICNRFSLAALSLLFVVFSVSIIYIEMFYTQVETASAGQLVISSQVSTAASNHTLIVEANEKTITCSELATYNGKNGMPAYVAVDGLVYDMSRVFRQGTHFEHMAGQELTDAFYSYHVKSEITKYPVVGTYKP